MRNRGGHRGWVRTRLATAGCAALASATAADAQSIGRFTAVANLSEGYSTNPLLTSTGDAQSVFAQLSFSPTYSILEANGRTSLSGSYSRTQYFGTDDATQSYGASLQHSRQLDNQTNVSLGINYDSSIPGERRPIFTAPIDPIAPVGPGDPDNEPQLVDPIDPVDPTDA